MAAAPIVGIAIFVGASANRGAPELSFREALKSLQDGDTTGIAAAIDELRPHRDFRSHVRLLTAGLKLRRGDATGALDYLGDVEPEGELRIPAMLMVGESLYRLGQLSEAESVLRQILAEEPEQIDAHRWMAAISYDLGANNLAITHLSHVVALDPGDYRPHRFLGLLYSDFRQHAAAIEHFKRALERQPPEVIREEIVRDLARVLVGERQYGSALEYLAGVRPSADVLALRGDCHWSLGQHSEAARCLQEAREKNWNSRLLSVLAARLEIENGSATEAARILTQVLKQDPHDAECRYQLAMCWRQSGDEARCREELKRWHESEQLLKRLSELSDAAMERPRDPAVREKLAAVCEQLGKDRLAEVWRQAAAHCRTAAAAGSVGPDDVR